MEADEHWLSEPSRVQEVERRLSVIRALLASRSADAVLLAARRNFAWATAGGANHVVLASELGAAPILVTADEATILAPINEAARIEQEEISGLPIQVVSLDWHDPDATVSEARMRAGQSVLFDADVEDELGHARSLLSPFDHERLEWLGARVRGALGVALRGLVGGESEASVAARVMAALAEDGVRTPVMLAAADDRIARYRHPLPSAKRISQRLMLVVVGERWGLHVAATRFRELERTDVELADRIEAVTRIHAAMLAATRPGVTFGDVLEAARRAYAETGYPDEWRLHHQGGSIGYQGRERIAVPGDPTPVQEGMAFAWNPSIAGAKAEETFILKGDGEPSVVTV